ncbi:leucine-rich repeat and fibronectin type-III domain-containing protein 3-like [Lethenteron reissneri]|uniref:leucine-rich repeat and fibronectin type-III domain-containing protein 3-like n=1 Tax=Lethenteron reissneri TaxID=7753 RepID=UPI002AB7B05B|nr:leucine-rich repeat and fibronectin type-III domain-containing protein 3-like [Lethenteron reissneri]XP_061424357.1 leucine-rich repeat and fibronectin type-III domain-containing protein 3-like [Lethenteron reissneri]XP_061424358.1 leucine-rich repeat and fibronectin type-III domain-containing protein 3-like [Lethenteron reissneri]
MAQPPLGPQETRLLAPAVLTLLALLLHQAPALCPRRCVCQNLSPSMATLCAKKGLLAVPATVDRRTVELRLADNYITRLRRQDLANMSGMVDLTLSRNALEEVEAGSFADLRVLRSLYLDGNRLTNISADTLRGLASLRLLTVSFNQLDHIAEGAFDDFLLSMEDLDLSYNSLEKVPWEAIQRMTNLHALGLDHNLLERVVAGSFAHLYKLARLDLSSNRLRTVAPDPLFSRAQGAGGGLLAVSLAGNPLHCNCELLWLRRQERQDLLETCSSPAHLSGRAFWAVGEDEFACEPPLITHHTPRLVVLEGQRATLRCRAVGDPEPRVHWLAPGGRVVGASGRAVVHANGTLEILSASPREDGTFTCFASNAAGEAIANVELSIIHLPRPPNETGWAREPDPGSSDIATPNRPSSSTGPGTNASESKAHHKRRVAAVDVAATSALVRWTAWKGMRGVRMYQVQYNGSADDSYVYRMMSPGSSSCLITGLLPGVGYQVCVLAIYYDGTIVPSVAATRPLGCVDFVTEDTGDGDSQLCSSSIASSMANGGAIMPGQLLGGTMIIIIGGIIVACLLVFTVILVIGYKACAANDGTTKTSSRANGAGATAAVGTSVPAGAADGYSAATAVAACHPNSNSSNSNGNNGAAAAPAGLPVQASYGDVVRELNQLKLAKPPDPACDVKPATLPRAPRTARLGADLEAESPAVAAAAAAATAERATLPRRLAAHRRSVTSMPQRSVDVSPADGSTTRAVWPRGDGRRATRSLSFDGGSFPHGVSSLGLSGAGQPRRAGGMWTKRSMSVNGMVPSVEDGKLSGRKAIFSSSDWILESTV